MAEHNYNTWKRICSPMHDPNRIGRVVSNAHPLHLAEYNIETFDFSVMGRTFRFMVKWTPRLNRGSSNAVMIAPYGFKQREFFRFFPREHNDWIKLAKDFRERITTCSGRDRFVQYSGDFGQNVSIGPLDKDQRVILEDLPSSYGVDPLVLLAEPWGETARTHLSCAISEIFCRMMEGKLSAPIEDAPANLRKIIRVIRNLDANSTRLDTQYTEEVIVEALKEATGKDFSKVFAHV